MGIKKFKVEFENTNRCFFPGQLVEGQVVIDVKKARKVKGLSVNFEGKATVSWSETGLGSSGNNFASKKPRKIFYRDIEPYFKAELTLLGSSSSQEGPRGSEVTIPSGKTTYPFAFTLPLGIPSSFVGKAGQVYYSAEIILRVEKSVIKQRFPFTVNGILDLNLMPGITEETDARKYKRVCCFCCQSGPIGFLLKLPKKGFVPGEPIRFEVEMSNQSKRNIKGITLSLVQNVSFHAKGNTFTDSRTIRRINGPDVGKGEVQIWNQDTLQIPPVPPTKLASCRIIDLRYVLHIDMEITGILGTKVSEKIPITIGTIPLRSDFRELRHQLPTAPPRPPPITGLATANSKEGYTPWQPPNAVPVANSFLENYPDLPPPSYEEALSMESPGSRGNIIAAFKAGRTNDENDPEEIAELFRIDETFTPRYLTYRFAGV